MTRRFISFCAAVFVFTGAVSTATAAIEVGDLIKFGNGPGSPGGIFFIDDLNEGTTHDFDTFCVQLEEFIAFGPTYKVANLSQSTVGLGARPLTDFAAWLYNSYLDETLNNFNYAIKHVTSGASSTVTAAKNQANELQYAIWRAMGYSDSEIGSGWSGSYDDNYSGWLADFTASGWTGTGDIYVMNLLGIDSQGNYTKNVQDQLVRIPTPGTSEHVPEPLSVAIWSMLGLVAFGICRKRC